MSERETEMKELNIYQLVPQHFSNESHPRGRLEENLLTLFSQLISNVNINHINSTVCSDSSKLIVAEIDRKYTNRGTVFGEIIGTATLIIMSTPHGPVGYVHDVVVDEQHRGNGIGRKLMLAIIDIARSNNLTELNLTTNSQKRPTAEALYVGLGFKQKPTGFYVLKLTQ